MTSVATTAQGKFDINAHKVEPGYFKKEWIEFEVKYRSEYPNGWGQFYAEYLKGNTDPCNLDYDEWAFLCEHFMAEELSCGEYGFPPGAATSHQEKPESASGFSFAGEGHCSIPTSISRALIGIFPAAENGLRYSGQSGKLKRTRMDAGS